MIQNKNGYLLLVFGGMDDMNRVIKFYNNSKVVKEITLDESISATVPFRDDMGYVTLIKGITDVKTKDSSFFNLFNDINLTFVNRISYIVDDFTIIDIYPKFKFKKEYTITDELYFGKLVDKNTIIYEVINIYQDNGGVR